MTIIPQPIQKPFRRFEIVAGLLCLGVAGWVLLRLGLWLTVSAQAGSWGEAAWLLARALYLLIFGAALVRRGYLSLVLWMIALAALLSIPVTIGAFG